MKSALYCINEWQKISQTDGCLTRRLHDDYRTIWTKGTKSINLRNIYDEYQ